MKLLKFEASWCQPCKQLSKTLETIDLPYPIEVIDIDENLELAKQYGIRGVPHLILLDDNEQIVVRFGGAVNRKILTEGLGLE